MIIISFSGIDGCGKSTHVEKTIQYYQRQGKNTLLLRTVRLSATGVILIIREWMRHASNKLWGHKTPVKSIPSAATIQPFKKARSFEEDHRFFLVILKRWLAYPFDALALRFYCLLLSMKGVDVVVCDRYTFDKLVNLPAVDCTLSRIVLWLAPTPNLSLFLDVTPDSAISRREDHDRSYYEIKYTSYSKLVDLGWGLKKLSPTTIDETQMMIEKQLSAL